MLHIFQCSGYQILFFTDNGMGVGMLSGETAPRFKLVELAVGTALGLQFFVEHYPPLLIQRQLTDAVAEMPHTVRLQKQRIVKRSCRHSGVIGGAIGAGIGVEVGGSSMSHLFQKGTGCMFAAFEHKMLKKMGKSGHPCEFIFRTNLVN